MSLFPYKSSLLVATSALISICLVISACSSSSVLGLPNNNSFFPNNPLFTAWINQCVQAKIIANNNNHNNNSSSAASAIANPSFALANARASCTQLLQSYINSNNNQQSTTQNQPSLTTYPPAYPYPYQYPYQQLQQQPQPSNTPTTQQYPYQNPYQYPYQQPYPATNQQEQPSPANNNNNAAVPPATSQYPYQNSYPYQQQLQNQSSPLGINPGQYPSSYQQLQPQLLQNQSAGLAANPPQQQFSQSLPTTTTGQPSHSNLVLTTHVNVTGGGNTSNKATSIPDPANFTQIVENAYTNPDGYTYVYHYVKASGTGTTLGLQPGTFSVLQLSNNNKNNIKTNNPTLSQSNYDTLYSGDCTTVKSNKGGLVYGYGILNPGETKTCTVTLSQHKQ